MTGRIRINVSASETMVDDAAHLAMCLAEGPADAATYTRLTGQDDGGHLYARASFEVPPEWMQAAHGTLQRPAWDEREDTPYIVNMAAARRAQAALVFDPVTPQRAAPGKITAVLGEPRAAFAAMGVSEIPNDI